MHFYGLLRWCGIRLSTIAGCEPIKKQASATRAIHAGAEDADRRCGTGAEAARRRHPSAGSFPGRGYAAGPGANGKGARGELWRGNQGAANRWLERFRANRHLLDTRRYDETFCRMWEYWLAAGVAAARASDAALYQVLCHNDRTGPIPLARV